jgi:hypothetical protein
MKTSRVAAENRVKRLPLFILFVIIATAILPAGNVYVAKYESQADVKIFAVKYESEADLCVRLVRYESQADKADEFWHYVKYESLLCGIREPCRYQGFFRPP